MNCAKCGNVLKGNSVFCSRCGEPVEQANIGEHVKMASNAVTQIPEKAPGAKKKWIGIMIVGCVLVLVATVIMILQLLKPDGEKAISESQPLVVKFGDLQFEVGHLYTYEELIKYHTEYPDLLEVGDGEQWTDFTVELSTTVYGKLLFHNDLYLEGEFSVIGFFMTTWDSSAVTIADLMASGDQALKFNDEKFVISYMQLRTEGASVAGIAVGDDLDAVFELYPEAVSKLYVSSYEERNRFYSQQEEATEWFIYLNEEGKAVEFQEFRAEWRPLMTNAERWTEAIQNEPWVAIRVIADGSGKVTEIHLQVWNSW